MPKLLPPPTERFTDRVDNYVKYRPGYPPELIDFLVKNLGLTPGKVAADIGAGTGIFTALLLEKKIKVFAVEPNEAMRRAAEEKLNQDPLFSSVIGTAENTSLGDQCVDFVFAAQAFHWFKPEPTRKEFQRILKPHGMIGVLWNIRDAEHDAFARDYESLLNTYGTDYSTVRVFEEREHKLLTEFFETNILNTRAFPQSQELDLDAVKGRLLSSSYCPAPGDPRYEPLMKKITSSFERNNRDGLVKIIYETRLYWR